MIRPIFLALWLSGLLIAGGLGMQPVQAAGAPEGAPPSAVVQRFHLTLIDNMRGGKALAYEGRRKRLESVVKTAFDLPAMARLSTGAAWQKMSEDDRAKIATAFTEWTIANYASNFREWDGEAFVTTAETNDGKGNVVVNTNLTQKSDPPVIFHYRLRKQDGTWRIVDIYLEGAISQLAMRRSEFSAVLARGGVDELIKHMSDLTAQAAKAGDS